MIASSRPQLRFEEYCQIESESSVRHEYQDGHAWAMAGGSREHAAIAANLVALLSIALRGRPCQVHTSDLRVRVLATGLATYSDVSVVCGRAELDPEDRLGHTVTNPLVLVEVLSPSTKEYDRGEKLAQYQTHRLAPGHRSGRISRAAHRRLGARQRWSLGLGHPARRKRRASSDWRVHGAGRDLSRPARALMARLELHTLRLRVPRRAVGSPFGEA